MLATKAKTLYSYWSFDIGSSYHCKAIGEGGEEDWRINDTKENK